MLMKLSLVGRITDMAKKGPRQNYGLVCTECGAFGYITERNKVNTEDKLELKKYCKSCGKHTVHKEKKKLK